MKKEDMVFYPAKFIYEDNWVVVDFPDLRQTTQGKDDVEALLMAKELLGLTMFSMEEDNKPIPAPSKLTDVVCTDNERVVLVDVYMPAVRLSISQKAVNRTVTIPAWLNAKGLEAGFNFSLLLQKALKRELGLE